MTIKCPFCKKNMVLAYHRGNVIINEKGGFEFEEKKFITCRATCNQRSHSLTMYGQAKRMIDCKKEIKNNLRKMNE